MSVRSRIDRAKFLEVKRAIKAWEDAGNYNADIIANENGIGVTTVRMIRRAKTWPKYQQLKSTYSASRKSGQSGRPMAGVRPSPLMPAKNIEEAARLPGLTPENGRKVAEVFGRPAIPKGAAVVAVDAKSLRDLEARVKVLEEWHDEWQKAAEELAEGLLESTKALDRAMSGGDKAEQPDDGPDLVNGHYAVFNEEPKFKKKRFGLFGGKR